MRQARRRAVVAAACQPAKAHLLLLRVGCQRFHALSLVTRSTITVRALPLCLLPPAPTTQPHRPPQIRGDALCFHTQPHADLCQADWQALDNAIYGELCEARPPAGPPQIIRPCAAHDV